MTMRLVRASALAALALVALAPLASAAGDRVLMDTRKDARGRVHATFRNAMGEVVATSVTEPSRDGGMRAVITDTKGGIVGTIESRADGQGGTRSELRGPTGNVLRRWSDRTTDVSRPQGFGRQHYNVFDSINSRSITRPVEDITRLDGLTDRSLRPQAPEPLGGAAPPERRREALPSFDRDRDEETRSRSLRGSFGSRLRDEAANDDTPVSRFGSRSSRRPGTSDRNYGLLGRGDGEDDSRGALGIRTRIPSTSTLRDREDGSEDADVRRDPLGRPSIRDRHSGSRLGGSASGLRR